MYPYELLVCAPRREKMAEAKIGQNGLPSPDAHEPSVWTGGCAGHDASMRVSADGDYILKPSSGQERPRLEELMKTDLRLFVPDYKGISVCRTGIQISERKEEIAGPMSIYIELIAVAATRLRTC